MFPRPLFRFFLSIGLLAGISACTSSSVGEVASGKVVSLGKQHLILQNQHDVIFLEVGATDKERLKSLKKGEKITLIGKKEVIDLGDGREKENSEVHEVVKENGTHIPLVH
jgi:hypothetical protein